MEKNKLLWNLSSQQLAEILGGEVLSDNGKTASGLATDTRQPMQGRLFIALQGDNFDAHEFVDQCASQGAHCVLVHEINEKVEALKSTTSVVKVSDTLQALQKLANWWRKKCGWKILAITGSSGKTTTKEILNGLLSKKFKVAANKKNFNNHWGVPFTLLATSDDAEVVIVEMGMNHLGEIATLCKIAEPNAVVCTMVGQAHIGELGSLDNIKKAKEEIYLNSPGAVRVFNTDNEKTIDMYEAAKQKADGPIITFSSYRDADIQMRANEMTLDGLDIKGSIRGVEGTAFVPIIGRHNTVNISAAVGLALAAGMTPEEIWPALGQLKLKSWGRNQMLHLPNGAKVLFDGYNANPESMAALIKNLFEIFISGKKIAVLGEMGELGATAAENHHRLGEMVGNTDIEVVWFLGASKDSFEAGLKAAGFDKTFFISDTYEETLALKIGSVIEPGDIVIVKGSRFMKLERVVQAWNPVDFELS